MTVLLPNIENANIDLKKLTGYVLNTNHPEGRHKAWASQQQMENGWPPQSLPDYGDRPWS
jgi:hypothetical protein